MTVCEGDKVTAVSVPDDAIEAVEWPDHPFALGVHWNPEDALMHELFRALISAATAPLFNSSPMPVQP